MSSARQPHLTARLQGFGTTIFTEMTRLAIQFGAVNLGQGFPNFDGPDFIKEAAIAAIRAGANQYCRMSGLPELNRAIAAHQQRFYDLSYDPDSEVTVYSGATEAICATLQALCDTGDEVVLFEPFYDSYRASVTMAGAVPKVVTLHAPDFAYRPEELEAAITPKTRAILLNSPHNPTGKVFARGELEHIAGLCKRFDLIAITDEVYEHLVYEGSHVPLATLPGMRERTVLISSSGKTFSFTGWKVGHTCAPPALSAAIRCAHQFVTFCTATPFQHALARAFVADDAFFAGLIAEYRARRDRLCQGLRELGFGVLAPAGTYFVMTDIRPLGYADDVEFCRMLPEQVGVAAIPPSSFYEHPAAGRHLVRWAFCKTDDVLDEGLRRLQKLPRRAPLASAAG
ncbi:succinyldiaminopimelate aminotransferase apoenzyme [Nannocystis exedens]|uniref:Succinyldiaminopimelate aminotransferase apoenzyme n=1 Tax=Nannocystis exedens TaxID=54 RepID=A0A1I1VPX9_9BACT|nr:methionine aminotransferase [Nannocystis exedens]PCC72742.1 aminotransferase [Nannocystis exedens]SFD85162.1 succinyldiaminopimelate aminotransferase apoenzyme [Nannocystis exedens]